MWDKKRQLIWVAGGILMGTYVAYSNSIDDDGRFVLSFFVFMETLILVIMAVLFYLYSRNTRG
ncbi:MAG TPA: hypothetical protein VFH46_13800 [Pyrinomonadaceae bacterium]|nr:hypothetical protein [Pyrinomonadaceae bacterium]